MNASPVHFLPTLSSIFTIALLLIQIFLCHIFFDWLLQRAIGCNRLKTGIADEAEQEFGISYIQLQRKTKVCDNYDAYISQLDKPCFCHFRAHECSSNLTL